MAVHTTANSIGATSLCTIVTVREPERLCVCLDTAHVFAAGYDLTTEVATRKTFAELDRTIALADDLQRPQ